MIEFPEVLSVVVEELVELLSAVRVWLASVEVAVEDVSFVESVENVPVIELDVVSDEKVELVTICSLIVSVSTVDVPVTVREDVPELLDVIAPENALPDEFDVDELDETSVVVAS